tara:strand:+ start:440 stop:688 length:249 start_codon:yes stop_codon:yes gene_type:complete
MKNESFRDFVPKQLSEKLPGHNIDYGLDHIADNMEKLSKDLRGFGQDVAKDLDSAEKRTVVKALKSYDNFMKLFKQMYKTIS